MGREEKTRIIDGIAEKLEGSSIGILADYRGLNTARMNAMRRKLKGAGVEFHVVNVGDLASRFEAGATVDLDALKKVGLAPKKARFLKILGWGDLALGLSVKAHAASQGARAKIEGAGGSFELLPTRPAPRPRGVKKTRDGSPS